jgi:cytoskeleton protein RodZ
MSDIHDETAPAPRSPGRKLAAARAARGLTVTEIALRLKFSPKQIEALEADQYDALAGPAFVRGMIRAYAKLVGADADALVAELRASPLTRAGPTVTGPRGTGVTIPRKPRKGSMLYVALSTLVVLAVGGVVGEWLLRPSDPQRAVVARPAVPAPPVQREVVTPLPVPAAEAQPQQAAPAAEPVAASRAVETDLHAKRIELSFNRESWVEIRDAEGRIVFSQLNPAGTRREVEGVAPFTLVIGNARGVRLRYNESEVDLMPYTRTDVARLTLD